MKEYIKHPIQQTLDVLFHLLDQIIFFHDQAYKSTDKANRSNQAYACDQSTKADGLMVETKSD